MTVDAWQNQPLHIQSSVIIQRLFPNSSRLNKLAVNWANVSK